MDLDLRPFGFIEFTGAMHEMAYRAAHPNRAFESIIGDFHRREEDAFRGQPTLVRTGDLRKSLTRTRFRAGPGQGSVVRMRPERLEMGTNVWYSRFFGDRLLAPIASGHRVAEDWIGALVRYIETGEVQGFAVLGL